MKTGTKTIKAIKATKATKATKAKPAQPAKPQYPYTPMKCRLRTGYKTKSLWACWDGESKFEVYRDLEESVWVASIDIPTGLVEYYHSKFSVKPNVKAYQFIIPGIDKTYNNVKLVSVSW